MEPITIEQYTAAIQKLLTMSLEHGGSGARACAQVLLSAYNGSEWQLDVTDLCALDQNFYPAAITVIRGRVELREEPQELVDDGNNLFKELWKQWDRFHVANRHLLECYRCAGRGYTYETEEDFDLGKKTPCLKCKGKGLVPRDQ
jgi:hypothetical protein